MQKMNLAGLKGAARSRHSGVRFEVRHFKSA
jgi:hypothetical protein